MIKILKSELFTRNAAKIICEPFLKGNLIPSKNTKTFINDNWESAYYEFIIPKVARQEEKLSIKIVRDKNFDYKIYPYKYAVKNVKEDDEYITIDDGAILSVVKTVQMKSKKRTENKNAYKFRNDMAKHILDEYLESIGIFAPSTIYEQGILFTRFSIDVNGKEQHVLVRTMPTNYEKEVALSLEQTRFRVLISDYSNPPHLRVYKFYTKSFRCGMQEIEQKLKDHFKIDTCADSFSNVSYEENPFGW